MLNIVDEFTHECLAIRVGRKLKAIDVIDVFSDLFILRRGWPHPLGQRPGVRRQSRPGLDLGGRSQDRLHRSGQPLENGYVESFNARLRDELLNGEMSSPWRRVVVVTTPALDEVCASRRV